MNGKTENLVLDFSHTYPKDIEKHVGNLKRIDLSDIKETAMYCSLEAKQEIKRRLCNYGVHGIHFLDNGNYHYMTKIFAEKIHMPFHLFCLIITTICNSL